MATIKQDIDIAEIFKYGVVAYGCYVIYSFINKDKDKSPDKNTSQAPSIPDGFKPGSNATITWEKGVSIAGQIKTILNNYTTTLDIQKVDRLLWVVQNDDDVEVIFKAFGTWDGPWFNNGTIFEVLNYTFKYLSTNGYQANWDSIRAHMYSRGVELNY